MYIMVYSAFVVTFKLYRVFCVSKYGQWSSRLYFVVESKSTTAEGLKNERKSSISWNNWYTAKFFSSNTTVWRGVLTMLNKRAPSYLKRMVCPQLQNSILKKTAFGMMDMLKMK